VFKRTNKQDILKGIYHENLWVSGKRNSRTDEQQSGRRHEQAQKVHSATLLGAAGVIVLVGVLVGWLLASSESTVIPTQTAVTNVVDKTANSVPDLVPIKQDKAAISEIDATSLPKTLQKKLHDVDNLEDLPVAALEDEQLNPADFEALAKSGVSLAKLFGLGVKTIVIDPGHGGKDPGAVGKSGIFEKDIVLEVARKLKERLTASGNYEVLMTREADDTISLSDRVEFANINNADLFVSIHINYFPSEQSFIETYYFGATDDAKVANLAKLENADSHYEYGDFKEIIQKIGDTMKYQESRQLAHSVQSNLYGRVKKINKHASDHGIKSAPFVVLLGLDAPSILTEVSCFCNSEEEKRLKTAKYRESIAAFLEKGIVSYLDKNTSVGGKRNGEKEKLAKAQQ